MSSVEHRRSRYLNNRAENSHHPPTTRTGDETLQIVAACATVPVRLQRHLRTLPAATASAQRDRMANRDGRPLRGLASGHRARRCRLKCERPNGVPSRLLQTQLRHRTGDVERSTINSRTHIFASQTLTTAEACTPGPELADSHFFVINDIQMTFQMGK
jgi:hypothetical protein